MAKRQRLSRREKMLFFKRKARKPSLRTPKTRVMEHFWKSVRKPQRRAPGESTAPHRQAARAYFPQPTRAGTTSGGKHATASGTEGGEKKRS